MSGDDRDWHGAAYPELREGPPWVMEEMIAAQPGLVEAIAVAPGAEAIATAVRQAASAGEHRPSPRFSTRRCARSARRHGPRRARRSTRRWTRARAAYASVSRTTGRRARRSSRSEPPVTPAR